MDTPITSNGHNRRIEKQVARKLYMSIVGAIILGMLLFLWLGQKPALNPLDNRTETAAPASR